RVRIRPGSYQPPKGQNAGPKDRNEAPIVEAFEAGRQPTRRTRNAGIHNIAPRAHFDDDGGFSHARDRDLAQALPRPGRRRRSRSLEAVATRAAILEFPLEQKPHCRREAHGARALFETSATEEDVTNPNGMECARWRHRARDRRTLLHQRRWHGVRLVPRALLPRPAAAFVRDPPGKPRADARRMDASR